MTRIPLDPRGTANINAAPWAEVWIDGEKAGETPMANISIRLGIRELVFKNPQFGERKVTTTVKGARPSPSRWTSPRTADNQLQYRDGRAAPLELIAVPFLTRRLRELRVMDDAREQSLVRDGIVTLADLELAIAEQRPSAADPALRRAAELVAQEHRPVPLGRAWDIIESFVPAVAAWCSEVEAIEASGPMRRAEPLVSSLVVVGRAADPTQAIERITSLPGATAILHRTGRRSVLLFEGHEIDVRISTADEYGSLLFATTGPPAHVAEVHKRRGPRLSASEGEVYAHAGLAWLPPETRQAPGAMDRAVLGQLPRLVQREDIRGDLHMHSTYSDGRDPLRRMVQASQALGYEYIAITDHSEHASAARTLTLDDLARQRDEIARLREETPQLAILHGLEVDILPDGSLDCPDKVLASLDIVLASLHESAGQDRRRLTERCLGAIRHPLVSVITHPANQLVGRRPATPWITAPSTRPPRKPEPRSRSTGLPRIWTWTANAPARRCGPA